jgi:hypothetical protein
VAQARTADFFFFFQQSVGGGVGVAHENVRLWRRIPVGWFLSADGDILGDISRSCARPQWFPQYCTQATSPCFQTADILFQGRFLQT